METILAALLSLLTLTLMEIVLGIDNVVFISILTGNLEEKERAKARFVGLSMALVIRIILLSLASVLIGLNEPVSVFGINVVPRSIIMFLGGTFLIYSAVKEIHHKTGEIKDKKKKLLSFQRVVMNIVFIDIVFSFDSILTAIGLVQQLWLMIGAVIISMIVMLIFSGKVSEFIEKYPSIKMLALSFLLMIGFILILDAFHVEIPKGYIYYAMFFSLFVVLMNIKMEKHNKKTKSIVLSDRVFKTFAKSFFVSENELYNRVLNKEYSTREDLVNDIIDYLGNSQNNYSLYLLSRYNVNEIAEAFIYSISKAHKELGGKLKTLV